LGSAKGWAGAFLYNELAKQTLDRFYAREDTLSLGVCNGCQLMAELGLVYPEHEQKHKMLHNDTHKYESNFLTVDIPENNSVLFKSLAGSRLGIWVAHGDGKFSFPYDESKYEIAAKYSYSTFPGNPNGSMYDAASVVSKDGRHLAIMPHLERSIFPWQWAHYPSGRKNDQVSPWIEAFVNAREWIKNR
jgi:phosphoribosylformylglycinamidine synthase